MKIYRMINLYLLKRSIRFWWQRRTRGWDDSDTWALDSIIAEFTVPRLKRFIEIEGGYPIGNTEQEWKKMLKDMLYALEICVIEKNSTAPDNTDWDRVERGLGLFGKYFRDLWW